MVRMFLSLVVALFSLSLPAQAADPPGTDGFVTKAAAGNLFEIESSKLALSRSKDEKVRSFATQMVSDHGEAATKFKKAVREAKLKQPPEALDPKHKAIVDDLRAKQGADFDKAYLEAQYKAHVETVELFESYAKGGDNARMKQFAQELLPTLRRHRDQVGKMRAGS